jgi:LDH2 family malate/lactate/ureidoglycolate dehydrogenase
MAKNWMMDHDAQALRVKPDDLSRFVVDALTSIGMSADDAETTANVLVTTDTWGVSSHGVKSLRGYVRRLRAGGLKVQGKPHVVAEGPAWAQVDGDNSVGMVTGVFAMRQAMEKARTAGIGLATVRQSCHFGAAGYYPALAAREGFIALAMANDIPSVSAPGARGAITGSNPFAYSVPTSGDPIVLDMASSTVAGGKVMAAHYHKKQIPLDWIKDSAGNPSADPAAFFAGGSLQPMAGHKGYGIALLIEMLAGCLSGAGLTWQIKGWIDSDPTLATGHGAAFVAIDVNLIMPLAQFTSRVDHVVRGIHDSPKAPGAQQIFVPGEIEWGKRKVALVEGIVLPPEVVGPLSGLAEDLGIDLLAKLPHSVISG